MCLHFQLVDVMELVQAVYNVLIQLVNVLAMLVTKAPNVMLLVVVIILVQVAQLVMPLQVNVLATQDTLEPPVIPVPLTTIEQVEEHVLVSFIFLKLNASFDTNGLSTSTQPKTLNFR